MRAVVLCCALVLAAAVASGAMGVDRASLQRTLRRDYPAGTRVSQLPLHLRVAIAQAAVATDAAANELALSFALAADASDERVAAEAGDSAFRFATAAAVVDAEAAETLAALFESPRLETAAQRMRFRAVKEALMAEAERVVRVRAGAAAAEAEAESEGPLSLFGGGDKKKKDKPLMNTGIGSLFGKVADKAKSVAHSTPIVGDVVKKVEGVDIHKLSGTVAKVAGAVNTVSGVLSPVLSVGTVATAAVPVVGEVMAAATAANTAVGVGSGVVATGAQLIHDNTKEGETLGQALGRAKDYAVAVGNDPTKLARDAVGLIRRKIAECKKDPSICVKLGLTVGSMAASIAGQGGLSKGMKLGATAIGIAQKIKAADDKAAGAKGKGKGKANAKSNGSKVKGKGKTKALAKGRGKRTGKGRTKSGAAKSRANAKPQGTKPGGVLSGLLPAGPNQSAQQSQQSQQQPQQQKPDVLSAVQQIMA